MAPTLSGLLAVLLLHLPASPPPRQDPAPPAPAPAPSASERVRALEERLRELEEALEDQFRSLQELPERERDEAFAKAYAEFQAKAGGVAVELLALARAAPRDPAALEAVAVALEARLDRKLLGEALALLEQHYARDPAIADVLPKLAGYAGAEVEALLRAVLEASPSSRARAAACFQLAKRTRDSAAAEELLERAVAELSREGEPGDPELKGQAERALFALRNLAVGKTAPDLSGADMDGVAFRLSDYRGKVVVLDFWGYW
jgi:hypothetical protein